MNLQWNTSYGRFSKAFYWFDHMGAYFLYFPDTVADYGHPAFTSALWRYMTPNSPNPSVHDVVIGRWEPNSSDNEAGITRSFGTSINILYGSDECGSNA